MKKAWVHEFSSREKVGIRSLIVYLALYAGLDLALLGGIRYFIQDFNGSSNFWWLLILLPVLLLRWHFGIRKDQKVLLLQMKEEKVFRESLFQKSFEDKESVLLPLERMRAAIVALLQWKQGVIQLFLFIPVFFILSPWFSLCLFGFMLPCFFLVQTKLRLNGKEVSEYWSFRQKLDQKAFHWMHFRKQWSLAKDVDLWKKELLLGEEELFTKGESIEKPFLFWQHSHEALSAFFVLVILALSSILKAKGFLDGETLLLYCGALLLCYKPVQQAIKAKQVLFRWEEMFAVLQQKQDTAKPEYTLNHSDFIACNRMCFSWEQEIFKELSYVFDKEATMLVGGNGVGKSTLLKLLAGLLPVSKGSIKYPQNLSGVAYLDQEPFLPYYYSEFEDRLLAFAQENWFDLLEVNKLLGRWKLDGSQSFSGGEKQKLSLALILSSEANVLLLDEPVAALPNSLRLQLLQELRLWAIQRKAHLIIASHDHADEYQKIDVSEFANG